MNRQGTASPYCSPAGPPGLDRAGGVDAPGLRRPPRRGAAGRPRRPPRRPSAGSGATMRHLADQVGELLDRAHEVPRGDLADVRRGHLEHRPEGGPPGPGGDRPGQAGLGLAGAGDQVDLLERPHPLGRGGRARPGARSARSGAVPRAGRPWRPRRPLVLWILGAPVGPPRCRPRGPATRRARRRSKTRAERTPASTDGSAPSRTSPSQPPRPPAGRTRGRCGQSRLPAR